MPTPGQPRIQDAPIVEAAGLQKRFGSTWALRGIDLAIQRGTIYGLLGPNGAGKTTAVRILATLLRPDGGSARVGGFDVAREPEKVRPLIGLTGQENLLLIARLLELSRRQARRRVGELLERFDLVDAGGRPLKTYSGGMRRRLDVAASLIGRPQVLFLDEPTTGLDPRGRGDLWRVVRGLVAEGATVLLTTQYLEEADQLATELAVLDHGQVIEHGTPAALKARVGGQTLDIRPAERVRLDQVAAILAQVTGAIPTQSGDSAMVSVPVDGRLAGTRTLAEVAHRLDEAGIPVTEAGLRLTSLDEVFLALTGHPTKTTKGER